jgi:predicted ester cyclase
LAVSVEENLDLVRRRFDEHPILVDGEEALVAIYSPDVVLHGPGESFIGIDGIKRAAAATRAAFSEIEMSVVSMSPSGDDRVVTQIKGRSVHTGEFQGIEPTGKRITVTAMVVSRIADGRIVEEWRNMTWAPE